MKNNLINVDNLRIARFKKKVSGRLQIIIYARYYADIKTYIETYYRNGINPTSALIDLMNDKLLKLSKILEMKKMKKQLISSFFLLLFI